MKTKMKRMQELKDAGFSANLTFTTMNKQGYKVTLMEVYSFFGIKMDKEAKPIKQYKVEEKLFTYKTTDEQKNRTYAICEMLNNGIDEVQIGKNLGISRQNVDRIKNRVLREKK